MGSLRSLTPTTVGLRTWWSSTAHRMLRGGGVGRAWHREDRVRIGRVRDQCTTERPVRRSTAHYVRAAAQEPWFRAVNTARPQRGPPGSASVGAMAESVSNGAERRPSLAARGRPRRRVLHGVIGTDMQDT